MDNQQNIENILEIILTNQEEKQTETNNLLETLLLQNNENEIKKILEDIKEEIKNPITITLEII